MNQDKSEDDFLRMTFDPNTIQHLGIKMYSNLPAAIAELVANSYDADAHNVKINLYDDGREKKIVVADDGHGMSFKDVNDYFLKIGRNRRSGDLRKTPGGRIATGKKGLGKLALFGIGNKISVVTSKKGEAESVRFSLEWNTLKNWDKTKNGPDYKPFFEIDKIAANSHFTEIEISELKRHSDFNVADLSVSLAKMFNFLDRDFKVCISLNNAEPVEITNELKYQSLEEQFLWEFPSFSSLVDDKYDHKENIHGKVITTLMPLRPGQRGVTLFANGRLVNNPEFFGSSESSHFFAYATGWLNVDYIDRDDNEDDVISTNRQSLDWEKDNTLELRRFLQKTLSIIQKEWREKRKQENKKQSQKSTDIDQDKWLKTLPPDKAEAIIKAFDDIADPESTTDSGKVLAKVVHEIAPEYAALHWRYLHPAIHDAAEGEYIKGNYFKAAREAALLYVQRVRDKSGSDDGEDVDLVFNPGSGLLMVTDCSNETEKNIQKGQQHLSRGVIFGCRNPLTHNPEFEKHLISTGLFDEKVCLDMLAMISHLFSRLDKAKKRT